MKRTVAIALLASSLVGAAPQPSGVSHPTASGPIATAGKRTVEEADIRRAAQVFARDPLRVSNPAAWRRGLLDRCVDRELLAMEAERRGFPDDPDVRRRAEQTRSLYLREAIDRKSVFPALRPTPDELKKARESRLYRRADIDCILLLSTAKRAEELAELVRAGAPFDSIARKNSTHPSATSGGRMGWTFLRDLDPSIRPQVNLSTPGQVLGPIPDGEVYWIYRVREIRDPTDDEISDALFEERREGAERDYPIQLLRKCGFAIDSVAAKPLIFALASEPVDSIIASLGPNGTRPRMGIKPALEVLARTDRDSITVADLARFGLLRPIHGGKLRLRGVLDVARLCSIALTPRLIERDARERGVIQSPDVARLLRLAGDQAATLAMVARATRADSDSSTLRAFYQRRVSRYHRPAAVRLLVATFATQESAMVALREWNGVGISDSALASRGFVAPTRPNWSNIGPRSRAELTLVEGSPDSLWLVARALSPGLFTPVVRLPRAFALGLVLGREEGRPLTFEEAHWMVARDERASRENAWVEKELERLRAKTPVRVVASRLQAVQLDGNRPSERRGG